MKGAYINITNTEYYWILSIQIDNNFQCDSNLSNIIYLIILILIQCPIYISKSKFQKSPLLISNKLNTFNLLIANNTNKKVKENQIKAFSVQYTHFEVIINIKIRI